MCICRDLGSFVCFGVVIIVLPNLSLIRPCRRQDILSYPLSVSSEIQKVLVG